MIYYFECEKELFHQELHSFEFITFDSRNVLVHLQFCNNNETIHFNQVYEELQPLESKNIMKTHKTEVSRNLESHLMLVQVPNTRNDAVRGAQS